ncbi:hypothetical protein [Lacticaseibacillus brantae]|uniref:hypothetical protein n=1 Tax=Lacticaseibacillus brantae TaxID=943673 RepID=UPI00070F12C0|nr:hypothetical protein [Lacticaseibacillus brantae]
MNEKIIIIRNDLKNKTVPDYKISGVIVAVLLSKEIFPHNSDLVPALSQIFSLQFKEYVLKSRTLTMARTLRAFDNLNVEGKFQIKNNLFLLCSDIIDERFNNTDEYWNKAKYVRI